MITSAPIVTVASIEEGFPVILDVDLNQLLQDMTGASVRVYTIRNSAGAISQKTDIPIISNVASMQISVPSLITNNIYQFAASIVDANGVEGPISVRTGRVKAGTAVVASGTWATITAGTGEISVSNLNSSYTRYSVTIVKENGSRSVTPQYIGDPLTFKVGTGVRTVLIQPITADIPYNILAAAQITTVTITSASFIMSRVLATPGNGVVLLTWAKVAGALSYSIDYGIYDSDTLEYSSLGTENIIDTSSNMLTKEITGLTNDITHRFTLRAIAGSGTGYTDTDATSVTAIPTTSVTYPTQIPSITRANVSSTTLSFGFRHADGSTFSSSQTRTVMLYIYNALTSNFDPVLSPTIVDIGSQILFKGLLSDALYNITTTFSPSENTSPVVRFFTTGATSIYLYDADIPANTVNIDSVTTVTDGVMVAFTVDPSFVAARLATYGNNYSDTMRFWRVYIGWYPISGSETAGNQYVYAQVNGIIASSITLPINSAGNYQFRSWLQNPDGVEGTYSELTTGTPPKLQPEIDTGYSTATRKVIMIDFSVSIVSLTDADGNAPMYECGIDYDSERFYITGLPVGTYYVIFSLTGYVDSDPFELIFEDAPPPTVQPEIDAGHSTATRKVIIFTNEPPIDASSVTLLDGDGNTFTYDHGFDAASQGIYITGIAPGTYYVIFSYPEYTDSSPFELIFELIFEEDVPLTVSTIVPTLTELFCTLAGASLPSSISLMQPDIGFGAVPYTDFTYDIVTGNLHIYNLGVNYEYVFNVISTGYLIPDITAMTAAITSVELADSQITVSWSPSTDYTYSLEATLIDGTHVALIENITESPQVLDALTNRTQYLLYITATGSSGIISRGIIGSYTLQQSLIQPVQSLVTNGDGMVTIRWPYDALAESYIASVYDGSTHIKDDTVIVTQSTETQYGNISSTGGILYITHSVTGLTNGTTYSFTITAVAPATQTWYVDSSAPAFTATPVGPPDAPVVSLVSSSTSSITISYTSVATATTYRIYYMAPTANKYSTVATTTALTYTISNLTEGAYKIKVVARRSITESGDSNIINGFVSATSQSASSISSIADSAAAAAITPEEKKSVKDAIDISLKALAENNTSGGTAQAVTLTAATMTALVPNNIASGPTIASAVALAIKDGDNVKLGAPQVGIAVYIPLKVNESVTVRDINGNNPTLLKTVEVAGVKKIEITDITSGIGSVYSVGEPVFIAGVMQIIAGIASVLTVDAQRPLLSAPVVGPTSVTYTISANQIAGANLTDVYYKLYVYAADGATLVSESQTTDTADTLTSVTFMGLTAGQTYKFAAAITTSNGSGVGPLSAIQDPYAAAPVCFFADAPVLTPRGYRPIASFKVGDTVQTADGRRSHVTRVFMKRYVANAATLPYKIPMGTLGATRDLPISPNHEVAVPGRGMVRARDLGLQQMSEKTTGRMLTYYNIELEDWVCDHMVVAGVTVESLAPNRRIEMTKEEFQSFVAHRYPTVELQGRLRRLTCVTEQGKVKCPLFLA